MQDRTQLHGASIASASHAGAPVDKMRPVDAMLDWQEAQAPLMAQWRETLDGGRRVLYGADGTGQGGAVSLVDPTAATIVWMRCADLRSWKEIGMVFLMSDSRARQLYDMAMDVMDATGYDGCVAGVGCATD